MTWEELKKQQHEELADYWKARAERQTRLRQEQQEIMEHCSFTGPKGPEIIQRIFREQREAWMDFEKEEFSQLTYWHEFEKNNLVEKHAKRQRLFDLLKPNSEKEKDRGR